MSINEIRRYIDSDYGDNGFYEGGIWMRRWVAWGLAAVASFLVFSGEAGAKETGCYSFENWSESQKYFEEKGGSKHQNIDGLDSDRDGLACEELIGFDPKHINPNNEKKPDVSATIDSEEKSWWAAILSMIKEWWHKW